MARMLRDRAACDLGVQNNKRSFATEDILARAGSGGIVVMARGCMLPRRYSSIWAVAIVAACGCGGNTSPEVSKPDASSTKDAGAGSDATPAADAPSDAASGGRDSPGDAAVCPSASHDHECTSVGQVCVVGTMQCECFAQVDASSAWGCLACPRTQPAEDAGPCTSQLGGNNCVYGPATCRCTERDEGFGSGWTCATCPATQPEESAPCSVNLDVCTYGDAVCTCLGPRGWDCLTPCPTAQPTAGDVCHISPDAVCTYGSTTCECVNQVYFCS
jgi:hypothetical protein